MPTIAHLSDPHLTVDPRSHERLRRMFDLLPASRRPDAFVVTGDLADNGRPEEYAAFHACLPAGVPTITCPGNHDDPDALADVVLAGDRRRVRTLDGPGWRVVALDSTVAGASHGELTGDDVDRATSACDGADLVVLALHHPPVPIGHALLDTMLLTDPTPLREIVTARPAVALILVGHAHTPLVSTFAGVPVVGAPGISSALPLDPEAGFGGRDAAPGMALHVLGDGGPVRTSFHFSP